jgi:hypothetical protein
MEIRPKHGIITKNKGRFFIEPSPFNVKDSNIYLNGDILTA